MANKKGGVRVNLTELKVMQSALKKMTDDKYRIQVGVFGEKAARKNADAGVTNAEVGYVHEMGSVTRHIPRRSFLWDTFSHQGAKLMAAIKPDTVKFFKAGQVDHYLKQCGIAAESLVREAFFTSGWGSWAPLAYSTLLGKLRGSLAKRRQMAAEVLNEGADHSKALIRSGQLWQAIASRTAKA